MIKLSVAVAMFVLIGQFNNGCLAQTSPASAANPSNPISDTGSSNCSKVVCNNGGSLVLGAHNIKCICSPNFSGDRCENANCQNNGKPITLSDGTQACQCVNGFSGDYCDQDCACTSSVCKTRCTIGLQTWGYIDVPNTVTGYISINYQTAVDITKAPGQATRGLNIVIMNVTSCTVVGKPVKFDPLGNAADTQNFINWVNNQANGTVLVAASADDTHNNFGAAYPLIKSLGGPDLNETNFHYASKLAFVLVKGYPSKGVYITAPPSTPQVKLNVAMSGSTVDNVQFVQTM